MTREIKFRAWDVNREEMVAVDHLTWGYGFVDSGDLSEVNNEIPEWFQLMQYTGLKDKNGVEIYEGDLIKMSFYFGEPITGEVYQPANGQYAVAGMCLFDRLAISEVIGNIYENQELLQGEEL